MGSRLHKPVVAPTVEGNAADGNKLRTVSQLAEISDTEREDGRTVVLCHGVFDLLHMGHVRHLQQAKSRGDILIVTITADAFVNKGPGKPAFSEHLRAEMLSALSCVDWVGVNNAPDATPVLDTVKPAVYAKGADYVDADADVTGKILLEREIVEANGGQIVFTDDIMFSSTELLNRHFDVFEPRVRDFLHRMRADDGLDRIQSLINKAANLRVLLVGDTIIDEYRYVTPMGKSPKENLIATRFEDMEAFAGGVVATANHVAALCKQVDVMTCLGDDSQDEKVVFERLCPNVQLMPIRRRGAPTTRKVRFIDRSYLRKLFEVYHFDDTPLSARLQRRYDSMIKERAADYDLVIVNDFGHGLIADSTIEALSDTAKFLAINAQTNSANHGFNIVTKYKRADLICIDGPEARLAVRDKYSDPATIVSDSLPKMMNCDKFALTLGKNGCATWRKGESVQTIPAFTNSVIDLVGAGDAFLAVSAPLAAVGASMQDIGFAGNVAGAIKVGIVGHRESIDKATLIKSIRGLLT